MRPAHSLCAGAPANPLAHSAATLELSSALEKNSHSSISSLMKYTFPVKNSNSKQVELKLISIRIHCNSQLKFEIAHMLCMAESAALFHTLVGYFYSWRPQKNRKRSSLLLEDKICGSDISTMPTNSIINAKVEGNRRGAGQRIV